MQPAHDNYQLGSLSHLLHMKTTGYQDLPDWPAEAPDATVRNVELPPAWSDQRQPIRSKKQKQPTADLKSFYSSSEDDDDDDDDDENEDSSDTESEEKSDDDNEEDEDESEDSDDDDASDSSKDKSESESSEEDDSSDEDSSSEEETSEEEVVVVKKNTKKQSDPKPAKAAKNKEDPSKPASGDADLLLDFDDVVPQANFGGAGVAAASGDLLTPMAASSIPAAKTTEAETKQTNIVQGVVVPSKSHELLNRLSTGGLSVTYKYTRTISSFSSKMVSIELTFTNAGDTPYTAIKIGDKKIQPGMEIQEFPEIASLGVGATTSILMGINFNDTTQPAGFQLVCEQRSFSVNISAPVGELMQPHTMGEAEFKSQQAKLGGMNENKESCDVPEEKRTPAGICRCVLSVGNLLQAPSSDPDFYTFAAHTLATATLVLVSVKLSGKSAKITVNCEKMVIGTMLLKDVKRALMS